MLESIEKEASGSATTDTAETAAVSYPKASKISVANLLNLVKGKAQKYIPKFSTKSLVAPEVNTENVANTGRTVEIDSVNTRSGVRYYPVYVEGNIRKPVTPGQVYQTENAARVRRRRRKWKTPGRSRCRRWRARLETPVMANRAAFKG